MKNLNENAQATSVKEMVASINEENVNYNRIYDYDDLSFGIPAEGNREINEGHVKNIYKHMDETLLGEFKVDIDTKCILDGNHRWFALKKYLEDGNNLVNPIRVIYIKRPEGQTVAEAIAYWNGNRKNWSGQDFIMSKKNQGDKYALELADFCNERSLLHTENVNKKTGIKTIKPIMRYGGWFVKGTNCTPLFKRGEYMHTKAEMETAKEVYNEIVKIFAATDITKTGTWFGEFVKAWRQVREEQKEKIDSLPNGFDTLIPEFEKKIYVNETSMMNIVGPNMRNLESVIDDAVYNMRKCA